MTPDATDQNQGAAASSAGMRVVRGTPDDAELAALVAGMAAFTVADAEEDEPGSPTSAWMDRARSMRGSRANGPLGRGASAWRHSLR
ncbi:acyl-CoA carboxylase subunit epsilon [Demequina aurantiaca]|uniref:acyl-CoA carboxylase subunit epsilon n=1 Tax=Demequina aurantiaca TaxID=676200 RepID=UPI000AC51BA9|nr:acyl-CoA carboxylase subunit epsilon [Demequina aurantiaca]